MGGTEIYVETLAHKLTGYGIESVVVAPSNDSTTYKYNELRVRRFRSVAAGKDMLQQIYGGGDPEAAKAFAKILDEEQPDVVHIHAFTRAVSVLLVRAAKQRGLPVIFTYHTPAVSCLRGNLMLWGTRMCDGVLDVHRCTRCSLHAKGVPRWATNVVGWLPPRFARVLEKANLRGGLWTALRLPALVSKQLAAFHSVMREVDNIVVLSDWSRAVLIRNGVPEQKITQVQHWLRDADDEMRETSLVDVAQTPLRVAFLGRAVKDKGADTLVKAVLSAPKLDIQIDLYGVTQDTTNERYWAMLRALAAQDRRIKMQPSVANEKVMHLLKGYHLTAVPSRGVENRPLVVLESLAAGTPVIGSRLGGIAELVRHNENGLLVDPEDKNTWADKFRLCAENRAFLAKLRKGTRVSRPESDLAKQMGEMYLRWTKKR
jgi:glycosyltransferase involved in cell wall biosynthesis